MTCHAPVVQTSEAGQAPSTAMRLVIADYTRHRLKPPHATHLSLHMAHPETIRGSLFESAHRTCYKGKKTC